LENIAVGLRSRYLNQRLDSEQAHGWGIDMGVTIRPREFVILGLSGLNIGSRLIWSTEKTDTVYPSIRAGAAFFLFNKTLDMNLDLIQRYRQPFDIAAGVQYRLLDLFSLRGGVITSIDTKKKRVRIPDFSLGVGIHYSWFSVDYAPLFPSSELGIAHCFSLSIDVPPFTK
jgi:hypothetical protein